MLVVIFVAQTSNYEVDAISAESAETVSLHLSQEKLAKRHTYTITENEISSNTNNVLYAPSNITVRPSQVPCCQDATGGRPGSATLARKLNSVSRSGAQIDDQNRAASFLTAIEALDKPPPPYNSKPSHGLTKEPPVPVLPLPAAYPTNHADKDRLVSDPWLAAAAYRAAHTERAAHLQPAAAQPDSDPATAAARASARGVPRQAVSYRPEAAADRLAALQEFLQTIEQLDRAP